MTPNVLEHLSKMVRKSSQNTPKIDLEVGLQAAWEPPLCRGDPKTSFLAILAPLWDPIWGPVLVHVRPLGPILGAFLGTFLEACLNLYVKRDMHENISIYHGLAMS